MGTQDKNNVNCHIHRNEGFENPLWFESNQIFPEKGFEIVFTVAKKGLSFKMQWVSQSVL